MNAKNKKLILILLMSAATFSACTKKSNLPGVGTSTTGIGSTTSIGGGAGGGDPAQPLSFATPDPAIQPEVAMADPQNKICPNFCLAHSGATTHYYFPLSTCEQKKAVGEKCFGPSVIVGNEGEIPPSCACYVTGVSNPTVAPPTNLPDGGDAPVLHHGAQQLKESK